MAPLITLSTSSVYPKTTTQAFEIAKRLGYDGVEVMVGMDATSQDVHALQALRDHYQLPITSIHAPCLLVTQRVWGRDPWGKLQRAQAAANTLGASTVVVHPPFRWQRAYADEFVDGIHRMTNETDVRFAVENMYPWKTRGAQVAGYLPDWDVRNDDYLHTTLDLSHTSVSGTDALAMASDLGDRLAHIHLADGSGANRDEHLVPGTGNQPVAQVLTHLQQRGFDGQIVVEISTRRSDDAEADLRDSLAFARMHS